MYNNKQNLNNNNNNNNNKLTENPSRSTMSVKITSYERKKRDAGQDASDTIDQRLYLKSAATYNANSVIGRKAMLKLKCERYARDVHIVYVYILISSWLMAPRLYFKISLPP